MRVFTGRSVLPAPREGTVLAVGNFDGVHLGHQSVFESAVRAARERGAPAVILTFSAHPLAALSPERAPAPIMAVSDRLRIAESFGFDVALVLDFDDQLAAMSPEAFTRSLLVDRLGVVEVVAGEAWRFGKGRKGDMALLERLGSRLGFDVRSVPPVMSGGLAVSSTRVREAIAAGDVTAAGTLLGRPHFVRGEVIRGEGRGRGLGFPTVNLHCGDLLLPADGVYACGYLTGENSGPSAVNIGPAPTFHKEFQGLEAHLMDWDGELYGNTVTIAFIRRLRASIAFPDAAKLAEQIAADVRSTRTIFRPDLMAGIP
ncbi:MAG: bifunctional riboflavin kinase/FAD synthetase [bacterium]|nr:MAG: bifunctional riboflavin kinase/FAD synthetase [bacterium]